MRRGEVGGTGVLGGLKDWRVAELVCHWSGVLGGEGEVRLGELRLT